MTFKNVFFNAFAALALVFGLYSCSNNSIAELEQTVQENTVTKMSDMETILENIDEFTIFSSILMKTILDNENPSPEVEEVAYHVYFTSQQFRKKNTFFAKNANFELSGELTEKHIKQIDMVSQLEGKSREQVGLKTFIGEVNEFSSTYSTMIKNLDESDYKDFAGEYIIFLNEAANKAEFAF